MAVCSSMVQLILLLLTASESVIIISEDAAGTDDCLQLLLYPPPDAAAVYCRSLQQVADAGISNVAINISSVTSLTSVALFKNVTNVTILGPPQAAVTCNSSSENGAGIAFKNCSNIHIVNINLSNCGLPIMNNATSFMTGNWTAILVQDSSNVTMRGAVVTHSAGQGVTFINSFNDIQIINSSFANNYRGINASEGGGLQIIYSTDTEIQNSRYSIVNCRFIGNQATSVAVVNSDYEQHYKPPLNSRGGGLRVILMKSFGENTIEINNTQFHSNHASYGGGLFVYYTSKVNSSHVHVFSSSFKNNTATHYGGGSNVGYTHDWEQTNTLVTADRNTAHGMAGNTIMFVKTSFIDNSGWYGGGLSVFTRNTRRALGVIKVEGCMFTHNNGSAGSAMYVGPDLLFSRDCKQPNQDATVMISNCTFTSNFASLKKNIYFQYSVNTGAVFINKVSVVFQRGTSVFSLNTNTALFVSSETKVTIEENSKVSFCSNYGENGGALYLGHGSKVDAKDNASLEFHKNRASFGGALYSELPDTHSVADDKFCFIVNGRNNVTFKFKDNKATSKVGNDMFAGTFQSCCAMCHIDNNNVTQLFEGSCIGQFEFNEATVNTETISKHISTGPYKVDSNNSKHGTDIIVAYSGMQVHLSIFDEVGGNIGQYYPLVTSSNGSISENSIQIKPYEGNVFIVSGPQNQSGSILVQASHVYKQYHITISDCPPGRYLYLYNGQSYCECNKKLYTGIHCALDRYNRFADIAVGYWAGYIDDGNMTPDTLLTGFCSSELCKRATNNHNGRQELPSNRINMFESLNEVVCAAGRSGVLCARCNDSNTSVYYHSTNYTCNTTRDCQYGILKYIVRELLPVTGLFLFILIFKISITSGVFYSFVFYAQTLSPLSYFPISQKMIFSVRIINVMEMFYNLFKLDATGVLLGPFCIVETDKIMVLLMFQYATVMYAFLLVLGTLLIFQMHPCYRCGVKLCASCGRRNISGSIVDGLSAFLVLCYAQCAQITYKVLNAVLLKGIYQQIHRAAPVYDGELTYLQGEHLYYAVPAILCIIFIIIPPPVILLLEPPLTKLFSLSHFNRSCTRHYYNRLRLKLMPFLDSFQACFRDKHRYVAGLYFLYRLIVPMAYFKGGELGPYNVVILAFFFIIFVHILLQPYKKKWHNQLELCILLSLLLVVILNYAKLIVDIYFSKEMDKYIRGINNCQALLLVLPAFFLLCYAVVQVYHLVWPHIKARCCYQLKRRRHDPTTAGEQDSITDNSFGFPARLLSDDRNEDTSFSYSIQ